MAPEVGTEAVHFYQRHIGDYQKDTSDLSLLEHGVYAMLLDHYYAHERALPNEVTRLHRICKAATPTERRAVETIVSRFFTPQEDGLLHNQRADIEIAKYNRAADAARENGKLGGRPPKSQNPAGNPAGTHKEPTTKAIQPPTSNLQINPPPPPESSSPGAADYQILFQRLKAMGIRAAGQCATDALLLRPIGVVMATLDYFEQNLRLPDGTMAYDQAMQYVFWRITSPDCAASDPAADWKEPDNPEFELKQRRMAEERRRDEARAADADRDARLAEPSPLETEFGPAVDAMTWDEATELLPEGPVRALASRRRRQDSTPGKVPMIRTELLRILSAGAPA